MDVMTEVHSASQPICLAISDAGQRLFVNRLMRARVNTERRRLHSSVPPLVSRMQPSPYDNSSPTYRTSREGRLPY